MLSFTDLRCNFYSVQKIYGIDLRASSNIFDGDFISDSSDGSSESDADSDRNMHFL